MKAILKGWKVVPLDKLVEILDGRRIPVSASERAKRPGEVPYYGASGQVGTIDSALFDEPLLLLGEDGVQFFDPFKSKAYQIRGRSWVNNHAHVLRVKPSTEPTLLEHYLNQFDYRGFANGTTRLKLTQAAMRRIPVVLPELEEQRRIVAILEGHLSDLDDAAVGLRGAGAKSIAMVAAARRAAVERAVEVGEPSTVGQRAILVEYGTSHKAHGDPDEGDIPVLRMGNVQDGRLEFATLKYLSPDAPGVRNLVLKRGDLLFNRTNSAELVGKSAVFEADIEATFASYLIRVRFNSSVRPEWANIVVNSPQGRAYITAIASQQVGQANVNGTKLKAFPLPVPSLTDQDEFIQSFREFESAAERLRAQTSRSLARTASLRRAVLEAAFSGRLTGHGPDTDVIRELAEEESA